MAKLLECIIAKSGGDKRRPANLTIVDYRHSEVALIEIMIGGLMRRAATRGVKEDERKRETEREKEGGDLKL